MIPQSSAFAASIRKGSPASWKAAHPPMLEFTDGIAKDICTAWQKWSQGLSTTTFTVAGLGIGAWTGSGSGAKLEQGAPFDVIHTWKYKDYEYYKKLSDAITKEYKAAFKQYCDTFQFKSQTFTGTCGSSGPVAATALSATLDSIKADAKLPDALKPKILSDLPSTWDNEGGFIKIIIGALQDATKEHFMMWEMSSQWSGDTFTFPLADPITGAASGPSIGTGKIT